MVTVDETLVRDILDRLIRLEALAEGQNQRIDDLAEQVRETNRRIDESNQSVNARIDTQTENLRREFRSDFNRQTFLILGFGAALIASVVTTSIFG